MTGLLLLLLLLLLAGWFFYNKYEKQSNKQEWGQDVQKTV